MWYERALVAYLSYAYTFSQSLPSINQRKRKKIEMNYTDRNGLDLTYYDTDFFGGPSEKMDYLINDENTTTEYASYIKIK